MNTPRVSVIVPVYNDAERLVQAVESVFAQTFAQWELLLVDDASTDATPETARRLAARDERVRLLHPGRNVGAPVARQLGLDHARGQLLALLDSDDYYLERYLERCVALYDEAVAAGRRPAVIAVDGYVHLPEGPTTRTWSEAFGWEDDIDLDRLLARNSIIARVVAERSAVEEVGGFSADCSVRSPVPGQPSSSPEFRYATSDDYDLWLRLLEAGYEVVCAREPLAVYRWAEAGRSRSPWLVAEAGLRTYRRALDRGALTAAQRRIVRRQMRHRRALVARGRFAEAVEARHRREALVLAPAALGSAALAFLQAPSRWGEWTGELVGR
jgi:glycosyltransferase involved in cell wall biosynthesis